MSGEIVREWYFWLISIATGMFMAFVYDVVRLFRRLVRHGRFAVDLEDIIYWAACFGLSFTLLYYGNNGVIRFAAVLGAAAGMAVYAVTVGRFFVRVSFFVIDRTIGSLFRLIRKSMRKLQRLLRPVRCFVRNLSMRLFQKIRLTRIGKRHKIKVHSHGRAKDGEGETTDGKKNGKRKTRRKNSSKDSKFRAKDTGVSPR